MFSRTSSRRVFSVAAFDFTAARDETYFQMINALAITTGTVVNNALTAPLNAWASSAVIRPIKTRPNRKFPRTAPIDVQNSVVVNPLFGCSGYSTTSVSVVGIKHLSYGVVTGLGPV